jgi:hypothetical protein
VDQCWFPKKWNNTWRTFRNTTEWFWTYFGIRPQMGVGFTKWSFRIGPSTGGTRCQWLGAQLDWNSGPGVNVTRTDLTPMVFFVAGPWCRTSRLCTWGYWGSRIHGTRFTWYLEREFQWISGKWPWYIMVYNISGCTSSSYSVAGELFEYYYSLLNSTAGNR